MMFLKGCVVVLILTFRNFLLCHTEELKRENTPVINDTEFFTNRSTFKPVKLSHALLNSNKTRVKLKYGRSADEHFPVTEDGYILKIFRLSSELPTRYCPILLVHGLFQSSDRFLNQNINRSLAFTLQDLGYDVWLFNARGNKHSRGHNGLDPERDKTKYFNYSFEEIGYFDLAATVDYILSLTTFKKIHYIGHSLGGTFFLVLNSLIPVYNDKFDQAFLMAPFAYHKSFPNNNLKAEFENPSELHKALTEEGTVEIFPYDTNNKNVDLIPKNCLGGKIGENICNELNIQKIMGLNANNNTIFDTRGGSVKTLIHLAQNVHNKKIRRWDYGEAENQIKYGVGSDPPEYPLSSITVRTKIIYASTDEMVNDTDIQELVKHMKNATTRRVRRRNFKHDQFLTGRNIMADVYDGIIRDLPEHEYKVQKTKALHNEDINESSGIPWTAIISLAGMALFMGIRIVSCFIKKKSDPSEESSANQAN